jgi:hypothetical protein
VISSEAYILTRVEMSAALTRDNVSSLYSLTAEALNSEALALGITSVA